MKVLPVSVTAGIEQAINKIILMDSEFPTQLASIQEKAIAIHLTDINLCLYLFIDSGNRIQLMSRFDGDVDATIRGSSLALTRMGLSDRPNDLVLRGEVTLEGDVHLAKKVSDLMAAFEIDWEEHLSKVTGDIVAHQVGNVARELFSWGKHTFNTLTQDMADYVVYEKSYVPTQHEIADFVAAVDVLRNDVDRMTAKIQQLELRSTNKAE